MRFIVERLESKKKPITFASYWYCLRSIVEPERGHPKGPKLSHIAGNTPKIPRKTSDPVPITTAQHPTSTSLLRIPIIDPSVLSFTQPGMVFFQLTWTWILLGLLELSGKITKNPAPFLIQWECKFGSILPNWKINLFQWSQIIHIAWGKKNLPRYTRLQEKLMRFTVPF